MNLDLPTVAELKQAAESGQRITAQDVSAISQVENRLTGRGPVRGGPAGLATAQSIAMKQMNFDSTIEEVSRKPQSLITQDDARVVQSTEGRAFNKPPGIGSVSAQVRSIANRNDYYNVPAVPTDVPAYITKDDARQAQRVESMYYGGQIPSYSTAANMQVSGRWDQSDGRRGSYY
ncbi:uncharacterized protein N7496_012828 [Penicillium cataractarum]|uniref:SMP domain-containing protein n=1 Tax=Penicillium cataractarum TaxID=2100454 RepID=A0A9W9R680_9EURO|nr:uncharacterized protein N7496_012828 [Penicillium cataractarum]KAJ5354395.1 hypothetical protein N7496_012828 [Penicillium cataractarum]